MTPGATVPIIATKAHESDERRRVAEIEENVHILNRLWSDKECLLYGYNYVEPGSGLTGTATRISRAQAVDDNGNAAMFDVYLLIKHDQNGVVSEVRQFTPSEIKAVAGQGKKGNRTMNDNTHLPLATLEALGYEERTEGADCTIINGAFTTGDLAVEAYCAGRTAPVTELEVKSAAVALFRFDTNWADSEPTPGQVMQWWDQQTPGMRERYERKARIALDTARKAVAE